MTNYSPTGALVPAPVPVPPSPRRVLVADDEAHHRWLVRLQLEGEADFAVVAEARDGAEAIAQAEQTQPDLVLLDVDMPGRDGLAALPDVRRAAPEAFVVVMSAYADEPGLAGKVAARGGDAFLDKDLAARSLGERLRALLPTTRSA